MELISTKFTWNYVTCAKHALASKHKPCSAQDAKKRTVTAKQKLLINLFIYFHYGGKYTTVFVERIIIKIKQVIIGPK